MFQLENDDDLYIHMFHMSELTATANVSFNFLFYIIGSKVFRDHFKAMFREKILRRKAVDEKINTVESKNTDTAKNPEIKS